MQIKNKYSHQQSQSKEPVNRQDIWYRNPMVWFVLMLPLGVVIASLFTISIAIQHSPQLLSKELLTKGLPSEQPLPKQESLHQSDADQSVISTVTEK